MDLNSRSRWLQSLKTNAENFNGLEIVTQPITCQSLRVENTTECFIEKRAANPDYETKPSPANQDRSPEKYGNKSN